MWKANHGQVFLHAPEGEGGEGGEGEGKGTPTPDPRVELLTQAVGLLAQQNEKFGTTLEAINATMTGLKPAPKGEEEPIPSTPDKMFEGLDLAQMDNAALAAMVIQKATDIATALVDKKMKDGTKGIEDRLGSLATTVHSKNAEDAFERAKTAHPDLLEWGPEMRKQIEQHPSISIAESYALARSADAKKAAEMDKKYAPKVEAKTFSLTPRGTQQVEGAGKMKRAEAALAAFDSIFGPSGNGLLNSDTKVV